MDLRKALEYIDPSSLSYGEWLDVGMGLKAAGEGYTWEDWDEWSKRDSRYQKGVCESKWHSFNSSGINKATVVYMAMQRGFHPFDACRELDWDEEIDDGVEPRRDTDFTTYLATLFKPDEIVNIVTASKQDSKGKYYPANSGFYKTSGELIADYNNAKGEIENVIGDYDHNAGVWVRINPLDGKGVKNNNVSDFRYTLIESDETDIETQLEQIYKLRLPCAAIVNSGGKSVHAVVKVDAPDLDEYNKRVAFIYKTLKGKNFPVDENNKNPARLTRLPGIVRGHERQFLVDTNVGYSSYGEWVEYVENNFQDITLPEMENFADVCKNMPELAPELIEGVLRRGHKMLLTGSSKAGKSFAAIELAVALASGTKWWGFQCMKSKVLYINLEIDGTSFKHRVNDVYDCLLDEVKYKKNLTLWNLRGYAQPLEKLTPKLLKALEWKTFDMIIIDPIYKVQGGDENSAGDITSLTNMLDLISFKTGAAVAAVHHQTKGAQGGKKAIDRPSGSGVFGRDPDALLDMTELSRESFENNEKYKDCSAWRVQGNLREFPPFKPVNVFFRYPIHEVDIYGLLDEAEICDHDQMKKKKKKKTPQDLVDEMDYAFDSLTDNGRTVKEQDMLEFFDVGLEWFRKKVQQYNQNSKDYKISRRGGKVYRTEK